MANIFHAANCFFYFFFFFPPWNCCYGSSYFTGFSWLILLEDCSKIYISYFYKIFLNVPLPAMDFMHTYYISWLELSLLKLLLITGTLCFWHSWKNYLEVLHWEYQLKKCQFFIWNMVTQCIEIHLFDHWWFYYHYGHQMTFGSDSLPTVTLRAVCCTLYGSRQQISHAFFW